MIEGNSNNLINTHVSGRNSGAASAKTSVNKYYNIFSKKMEEIELPDIDLEHNTPFNPNVSTFMRSV